MTSEQAIERLNLMIEQCERYEDAVLDEDNEDMQELLHDTELDIETLRMAVRALESKPRWISCSERLPREEDKVLCCTQTKSRSKNIVLGYYADGKWRCGMNRNVVAWMVLPEAYSEED